MIKRIALFACALLFAACSNGNSGLSAAPLGDRAVLEKLAAAWQEIAEAKMNVSPSRLPGDKRRRFVGEVFASAGYDYTKTLRQMAIGGIDKNNKLHKDLAELVLMPHRNQRGAIDPTDIYSMDELKDVAAVERQLNQ